MTIDGAKQIEWTKSGWKTVTQLYITLGAVTRRIANRTILQKIYRTHIRTFSPPFFHKKISMSDQLSQLEKITIVVADTGDINSIKQYKPTDATTNPSLLYAAAQMDEYKHLVGDAVSYGKKASTKAQQLEATMDKLAVNFGVEILKIVPGVVSTEVDARLSFDTQATLAKARTLIKLYEEAGIAKERVLIKIASTWEGLQAARVLEREGIHVNMTLLFNIYQAAVAAENSATLISPFVGRIMDWHKADKKVDGFESAEDPGVHSVTKIYNYYKQFGYDTVVMGASFRNVGEILELAGCDKLTIAPAWLKEMRESNDLISVKLSVENASKQAKMEKLKVDEASFRWGMNEDAMATEKLAEGIRKFAADSIKLEQIVQKML